MCYCHTVFFIQIQYTYVCRWNEMSMFLRWLCVYTLVYFFSISFRPLNFDTTKSVIHITLSITSFFFRLSLFLSISVSLFQFQCHIAYKIHRIKKRAKFLYRKFHDKRVYRDPLPLVVSRQPSSFYHN